MNAEELTTCRDRLRRMARILEKQVNEVKDVLKEVEYKRKLIYEALACLPEDDRGE